MRLCDMNTISQVDVVETLKEFVYKNLSADIENDAAFQFASKLTGLSTDALADYVYE